MKHTVAKEFICRHDVLACEIDGRKVNVQRGQPVPVGATLYGDDGIVAEYKGHFAKADKVEAKPKTKE